MCRLLSNEERCKYQNSQLMDVVCRCAFRQILSITARTQPFQEAIRMEYPRYAAQKERPAPKVTGLGTDHPTLEQQPPVTNFCFVSDNGKWRVNLTNRFIALSTQDYRDWEDFAPGWIAFLLPSFRAISHSILSGSACAIQRLFPGKSGDCRCAMERTHRTALSRRSGRGRCAGAGGCQERNGCGDGSSPWMPSEVACRSRYAAAQRPRQKSRPALFLTWTCP